MIMHCYTRKYLVGMLSLIIGSALGVGVAIGHLTAPEPQASVTTANTWVPSPVPTGSPSPSLPPAEDMPGWDCRTQGNHVCEFAGDLWLNLSHLPPSLYVRCGLGVGAVGLNPEVASIDTEIICDPLRVNG